MNLRSFGYSHWVQASRGFKGRNSRLHLLFSSLDRTEPCVRCAILRPVCMPVGRDMRVWIGRGSKGFFRAEDPGATDVYEPGGPPNPIPRGACPRPWMEPLAADGLENHGSQLAGLARMGG